MKETNVVTYYRGRAYRGAEWKHPALVMFYLRAFGLRGLRRIGIRDDAEPF